jgi:succinyl-diaminopimelate desuccinylase
LTRAAVDLALDLVAIPSPSGEEREIADALHAALSVHPHLRVLRDGDTLVARTELGRAERVVVAGHLDTVPAAAGLVPALVDGVLRGRGSVDMKAGVAAMAHLAATLDRPSRDVTWVFYDHEEVARDLNGLRRVIVRHPEWVTGTFAVLGEPTSARLEGGCNGSIRVRATLAGKAAHAARAWLGANAIHAAAPLLERLARYTPARVRVDGLEYRESLNAVLISGGTATNVIPDRCTVTVNYRFAPDKTVDDAVRHLSAVLTGADAGSDAGADAGPDSGPATDAGLALEVVDRAPGARPGLEVAGAKEFARVVARHGGGEPTAKVGWTDVAQFAELGIPAVNCGPGDPGLAHADNEHCPLGQIDTYTRILREWLG